MSAIVIESRRRANRGQRSSFSIKLERGFAALDPLRLARLLRPPEIEHVEAADRDIRLVAVLFPEQQLVDLGLRKGVFRQQRAAARQEPDDRVRLRQAAAVIELDRRHLSHRIAAQRLRRPALALADVDRGPAIRQAEMIGRVLDLEAVSGREVAVDDHEPGSHCWSIGLARRCRRSNASSAGARPRNHSAACMVRAFSISASARRYSTGITLRNIGQ